MNHLRWKTTLAAAVLGLLLILSGLSQSQAAVPLYSLVYAKPGDPTTPARTLVYTSLAVMPKRYATTAAQLSAQPDQLIFLTEVATTTLQTQTLTLNNPQGISWTASISGAIVQSSINPISGAQSATITISIDPSSIGISGTYTASLLIVPNPISASNSITIPITIITADHWYHSYLPLINLGYALPPAFTGSLKLGLNFVSSAEEPAAPVRYQRAADLRAVFNRHPMYWPLIETNPVNQPRVYDWSKQDAVIISDMANGLQVLPILMLTPIGLDTGGVQTAPAPKVGDGLRLQLNGQAYQQLNSPSSQGSPPQGLYDGIFANGVVTDDVPGKPINPNNRWAYFVNAAVDRYKPGGTLAQAQGWISTTGITHWEIWNEEDLDQFFIGSPTDYARLLKVAYLAAKQADPQAEIIFGGLAHFQKPTWLSDVLNVIATDPLSTTYHGYMDAVASHSYSWAWQTFNYMYQDRTQLNARGFNNVRLWLTETGVPVCDDPPYVFCPSTYRSTMSEQADYLIQSLTYAQWLNAEGALWFQLYDDCGNDGHYDAFGLVRNPASVPACPLTARDGTPRLAYTAYQVFNDHLIGAQPYWRRRPTANQELIAFKRPATGDRIVVMWARSNVAETVTLSATASSAKLIQPNGSLQLIFPINGVYTITLPAATNYSTPTNDGSAAIGGSPRLLIESDPGINP